MKTTFSYEKGEVLIHRKTGKRFLVEAASDQLVNLQEDGKAHPSQWPKYEVDSDFISPMDLSTILAIPFSPSNILKKSPVECHRIMNNQRRALKIAVDCLSGQGNPRESVLHLIWKELTE